MNASLSIRRAALVLALGGAAAGCQRSSDLGPVADSASASAIRKALLGDAGAGGAAAAAPTGTGWATLRGTFKFAGDPPQMPRYNVDKDEAVCKPGGAAPFQELLVVDSATSGIANVAVYPRSVLRVHESAEPGTEPLVFDQRECVFLTRLMGVTVGTPVSIKNSDPPPVGHNTSIAGQNKFNQTIPPGEQVTWTAKREEALPVSVRCSMHPWMLAYMLPRKTGYFAITGPDGSFEIANLPAGEKLEFQVWHESAAGAKQVLVVDTDPARELDWDNKGRFTLTLEENETREIEIVVPPSAFRLP